MKGALGSLVHCRPFDLGMLLPVHRLQLPLF
jgi:hypothetical protein